MTMTMTIISNSNRRLTYLVAGWMLAILAKPTAVLGYTTSASPPPAGTKFKPGPWGYAHATFYGDETGGETMGGACGYGNLFNSGYGFNTAALSTVLFKNGESCGQCFQLICAYSKWCYKYTPPITITSTNLCPPNWYKPNDDGGWCNPPRPHFDLSKIAFMKIAVWTAGIVPVYYRRVPCIKQGGMRFKLEGNPHWLLVYVMNVGGAGDISDMWVKGTNTDWLKMSRNWGAAFQAFEELGGQALSFKIKSRSTGQVLKAEYVTNNYWSTGVTYQSNVNFR